MGTRHEDRHTIPGHVRAAWAGGMGTGTLPPHAINYRANLAALAEAGAEAIVADLQTNTLSARRATTSVLRAFFEARRS